MVRLVISSKKIHTFTNWWVTGLYLLIPNSLRYKIFQIPDSLSIEVDGEALLFSYFRETDNTLIHQKIHNFDDELEKADIIKWLNEVVEPGTRIVMLVDKNRVLTKNLSFPLSSESRLGDILVFEMDRQTPFTVDQIYYDYQITNRDYQDKKLQIELYVLPRNAIDNVLGNIRNLGLVPDSIRVRSDGQINEVVNLMPVGNRSPGRTNVDSPTRILFALTCLLLLAVLYLPTLRYQGVVDKLENEVAQARIEALKVASLKKERDLIIERKRFLAEKQSGRKSIMGILAELTVNLPDNTYLNRLVIDGNNIQMEGESDSATAILPLIEQSSMFRNAQFRSPVTRNNASNKDRLQISADLTGENFK